MIKAKKMRILSCLMTLAMMLSLTQGLMLPVSAADANDVWDGTADTTWYNTTDTSFTLTTPEQLAGLSSLVNQDVDTFEGKTILLGADLQMNADNSTDNEWTPIGQYVTGGAVTAGSDNTIVSHYFRGTFNGCGHMVRGIYVDNSSGSDDACERNGLFAMNYGTIENVGVSGEINTYRSGGSIAGYNEGAIRYCYGSCTINANGGGGRRGSGGVAGQNFGVIEYCWSDSSVYNAYRRAGGIAGYNCAHEDEDDPASGYIGNCWFNGYAESKSTPESVSSASSAYDSSIVATNDSTVEYCYYLTGSSKSGYGSGYGSGTASNVEEFSKDGMLVSDASVSAVSRLTAFSNAVTESDGSDSGILPILYWQKSGYTYTDPGTVEISLQQQESGGTVSSSFTGTAAWGTDITLSNILEDGFKFLGYTVNGTLYESERLNVTRDVTISALYQALSGTVLTLEDSDAYSLTAVDADGNPVQSGDIVTENETITVSMTIKPGAVPEDESFDYNGKGIFYAGDTSLNSTAKEAVTYTMTDQSAVIRVVPDTSRKEWISLADTSWYQEDQDTFTLTTPQQLAGVAALIREGVTDFEGKTILLGNDLDLTNPDGTSGMRCWSAIGAPSGGTVVNCYSYRTVSVTDEESFNEMKTTYGQLFTDSASGGITTGGTYTEGNTYYARCAFRGTFDGQNHSITGFYYNFDDTDTWFGGLFGETMRAEIRNVSISGEMTGSESRTSSHAGAVVAYALDGTKISGCENHVSIHLSDNLSAISVGGILGDAYAFSSADANSQLSISDCANRAEISIPGNYAGGIAGKLFPGTVTDCINYGAITAKAYVGGIAGSSYTNMASDLVISQCGNEGSITSLVEGTAAGTAAYTGGILGGGGYDLTIEKCYNHGKIDGGEGNSVGGIAGRLSAKTSSGGNRFLISSCYNTGTVESAFNGNSSNVTTNNGIGGLVGMFSNMNTDTCIDSYNAGAVRATRENPTANVYTGGIAGLDFTKYAVDLKGYYLSDSEKGVGCLADSNKLHKGTESTASRTEEEMKSEEFVETLGENFKAASVINDQYPILQWETEESEGSSAVAEEYGDGRYIVLYEADALPSEGSAYQAGGQVLAYVPAYSQGSSTGKYVFAGLFKEVPEDLSVEETEGTYRTVTESGDVSENGRINIIDAQIVCNMVNEKTDSSVEESLDWFQADVNASRSLTMADARAIQYYVHYGVFAAS